MHRINSQRFLILGLLLSAFLGASSLAVYLNRDQIFLPAWKTSLLSNIQHEAGFAYLAASHHAELSARERPSLAQVLQDGYPLPGPDNALHDEIRKLGAGRYSFWHDSIYFSTSDNSDPATNGRHYAFHYPLITPVAYAFCIYATTLLVFVGIAVLYISRNKSWLALDLAAAKIMLRSRFGPPEWRMIILVLMLASVIAIANAFCLSKVNAWVLATAPLEAGHDTNTIIGYSWLLDGNVIHIENISPLEQSLTFNGQFFYPDGYYLRPLYPFLVSLSSWMLGLKNSALAINYLAFAIFVVATGYLGYQLAGHRTPAILAGLLACTSPGLLTHLNDLSAHLLGNALCAVVIASIYSSRVWCGRREGVVHVRICILLVLLSLAYPSGATLTTGYVLTAIWYSRWIYVVPTAAAALLIRPIWGWLMSLAYIASFGLTPAQTRVSDFSSHAAISAEIWQTRFGQGLGVVFTEFVKALFDCLFVSFPLITIAGLAGVIVLGRHSFKRFWILIVFIFLPWCGAVFFSPAATARGYIVVGSSVILFAALAAATDIMPAGYRRLATAIIAVAAIIQLVWSLAYLFGYYFPLKAFFLGSLHAPYPFIKAEVHNLTGEFPLWRFYGGTASFLDAGGLSLGSIATNAKFIQSFGFSVVLNGLFLALFFALAATLLPLYRLQPRDPASGPTVAFQPFARRRTTYPWMVAWGALTLIVASLGYIFQRQTVTPFATSNVTRYAGRHQIHREIDLSPSVISTFKLALERNAQFQPEISMHGDHIVQSQFALGPVILPAVLVDQPFAGRIHWRLDRRSLLKAITDGQTKLSFSGFIQDGTLGGWQRGDVRSQRVSPPVFAQGIPYLPSFELRLFDPIRHTMIWIGY